MLRAGLRAARVAGGRGGRAGPSALRAAPARRGPGPPWMADMGRRWLATEEKTPPDGAATRATRDEDDDEDEGWEWIPPDKSRARAENLELEAREAAEDGGTGDQDDELLVKADEALDAAVWFAQNESSAEEDYARNRRQREASWTWESGLVDRGSKLIRVIPGVLLTVDEVHACLEANGAENIVTVPGTVSGMREDSILATGRSSQHILRLAKILHKSMRKRDLFASHENKPYDADENWVVFDAGRILVHVFTEESRNEVRLEDKLLPDRYDEQMEELRAEIHEEEAEDRARRRRRTLRKRLPVDDEEETLKPRGATEASNII